MTEKVNPRVPLAVMDAQAVTTDEYRDHEDACDGVCISCGEWTDGGCESDARAYQCESCGKPTVYGCSEALIMGNLVVED